MASSEDDAIPGTEIVYRPGQHGGPDADHIDLVLIPRPSSTAADDPLNWTTPWKTLVLASQFVFVFVSIMTPLAIAPLTHFFMLQFDKTLPQVNLLFGVAAITLGFANFLIVPAANVFGRRPIVAICGIICLLANVWQALVTSFPSFIGARVISGLGAAANESIMPMVVADILFLHQRGQSMALYFWAYFLGLFFGPIIAGSIGARISWRWFFWVCTILQGVSLIFIVVAFPETKYVRPVDPVENMAEQRIRSGTTNATVSDLTEKAAPVPHISSADVETGQPVWDVAADAIVAIDADAAAAVVEIVPDRSNPLVGRGRPARWQWSLVPKPRFDHGLALVVRDLVSPIQLFLFYPIVLWASLAMGFAANSLLALNLTQAQVFLAPPYNFSADQVGYVNFSFAVGAAIALLTAGPLSDWIALRAARRNSGVLEAEMRLPALIPFIVVNLVGMVVTAVGYQRGWDWAITVVVGYGLVGMQVVGIPAIVIAYAVDCYKHLPGEIMIAATIVKNTFGFGMIFYYNDWASRGGYLAPVLMLMAITVGLSVLGLAVFVPFGKALRRWTRDSKMHTL